MIMTPMLCCRGAREDRHCRMAILHQIEAAVVRMNVECMHLRASLVFKTCGRPTVAFVKVCGPQIALERVPGMEPAQLAVRQEQRGTYIRPAPQWYSP